jgi:transposase
LDVRELIRRMQLGEGIRRIARELHLSRKTVSKYRAWAEREGVLSGPLPPPGQLQALLNTTHPPTAPPQHPSSVEPYRDRVVALRRQGVECKAILGILREEAGYGGSYSSLYRFVRALEPPTPEAFVRVETPPGEEAQVDFGYAGLMYDPRRRTVRKTWAFVMTLSFSRHQYVEFVFDQEVATWLRCHRDAFELFGGVPKRVVIDNLKAAIAKAAVHDPVVQRAYREFAEHYGFLISPCRPRTPRHKGKVEKGGVHYLKRNFLAGRSFRDIVEANERGLRWCVETAGRRIHGTTKQQPLERFDEAEREALMPLPEAPYTLAVWKKAKLHPDCHVVFGGSFYSAPHRLIGKTLWVRATDRSVTLFLDHDHVASHSRATRRGERKTRPEHLPPAKIAGLMASPAACLRRAGEIGPHTSDLIGRLLGERPLDRLRTAQAILRLAHKYSPRRLETACRRALAFDETGYGPVKRILDRGLDHQPLPAAVGIAPRPSSQPPLFARPWSEFFPQA